MNKIQKIYWKSKGRYYRILNKPVSRFTFGHRKGEDIFRAFMEGYCRKGFKYIAPSKFFENLVSERKNG